MTTSERRAKILKILQMSSQPVAGKGICRKIRGQSSGYRTGYGSPSRLHSRNSFHDPWLFPCKKELLCTREFKLWHPQRKPAGN